MWSNTSKSTTTFKSTKRLRIICQQDNDDDEYINFENGLNENLKFVLHTKVKRRRDINVLRDDEIEGESRNLRGKFAGLCWHARSLFVSNGLFENINENKQNKTNKNNRIV